MGNDHEDRQQQQQRQPQNHPSPSQNTGSSNDGNDMSSSVPSSSTVPNVAAASAPDGVTASAVARSNTSTNTTLSAAVGTSKSLAIESSHANEAKTKATSAVSSTTNQWSAQQLESRKDRKKDKKKKKRKKRSRKERDKEGGGDNDKKKSTTDERSSKGSSIKDDKTKVKASSSSSSSMTATTNTTSNENKGQERETKRLKMMAKGSKDDVVTRCATTKDKEKPNSKVSVAVASLTEAHSSTRMSNEKEVLPKKLPHPTNVGDNDSNKNAKLLKHSTIEHASEPNNDEKVVPPPEERLLHPTKEDFFAPASEQPPNSQLTTALDHVCHFLQVPPLPSAESSFVISSPPAATTTAATAVQGASISTTNGSKTTAAASSSTTTTTTPLPPWMVDPSWDVTPYDIYRHPRKVECDGRKRLTLPLKQLNGEFCCVICLGYIRKTSIVMVCLHRFCAECIQKCLRLGKRECPTCRVHIPSRRSLRPDPNYDALIQTILGNVDQLEEQQQATITKINQTRHMNTSHTLIRQRHATLQQQKKALPPSTSGGISVTSTSSVTARSQQPQLQSERGGNNNGNATSGGSSKRRGTSSSGSMTSQDGNQPRTEKGERRGPTTTATTPGQQQQPLLPHTIPPTTIENLQISPLVGFILRKDPQERRVSRLRKEFLRVHPAMTMWYIKDFLSRKLSSPWLLDSSSYVGQIIWEPSHFQLLTLLDGQPMILKDTMTIGDVQEHMWDIHDEELIIHYRTIVTTSNKTSEEAQLSSAAAASSQTILSK